jgi:hypothetical protein
MPELFKTTVMPIVCNYVFFFLGKGEKRKLDDDGEITIHQYPNKRICTIDRWTETEVVDELTNLIK